MQLHPMAQAGMVSAFALLLTACQTTVSGPGPTSTMARPPVQMYVKPTPAPEAVAGRSVKPLLEAAKTANARCEFFAEDGTPRDQLPEGAKGSVSIHRPEGGGQDNYAVEADGTVTRHLRSYGADYDAGVWKAVP